MNSKAKAYLRVCAVFVSLLRDDILIGIFFVDLIEEFSFNGWPGLNWIEFNERITNVP